MPFNQQMGFPVDLSLQTSTNGIRLVKWPVPEIRNLFSSVLREDLARPLPAGTNLLSGSIPDTLDLEFEFQPGAAREVRLDIRGVPLHWDSASGNLEVLGKTIPSPVASGTMGRRSDFPAPWGPDLVPWDRSVRWRILVDRTSLEIFVNGGTAVGSFCWVPREEPSLAIVVKDASLPRARLVRRTLKSAWRP